MNIIKLCKFSEFAGQVNRYSRKISNDYLLPNTVGRFQIETAGFHVCIFEEREGFTKFMFRVNNMTTLVDIIKLNVSAFTVNKRWPGLADDWLTANCFDLKQERVRYIAAKLNIPPVELTGELEVVDASVAYPIYRRCFDMALADLPLPEMFEGALCVRDNAGKPVGVLSLGADRHIGVLPECRGQGIAVKLYAMLVKREPNLGTQRLFADVDNPASNALYKKLGFKQDGVILRCYKHNGQGAFL